MARQRVNLRHEQPCAVPDCQSPAVVKGLCVKHQLLSAREMAPITTMERKPGPTKPLVPTPTLEF